MIKEHPSTLIRKLSKLLINQFELLIIFNQRDYQLTSLIKITKEVTIAYLKGGKNMFTPENIVDYLEKNHLYIQEVTRLDVDPYEFLTYSDDPDSYVDNNSVDSKLELIDEDENVLATGDDQDIYNAITKLMKNE